jgi:hypothetical protein
MNAFYDFMIGYNRQYSKPDERYASLTEKLVSAFDSLLPLRYSGAELAEMITDLQAGVDPAAVANQYARPRRSS